MRTSPPLLNWLGTGRHRTEVRGAAIVELLIGLPVLLVLFVSIIELGTLLYQIQIMSDAVRQGTRAGAIRSGQSINTPCWGPGSIVEVTDQVTTEYIEQFGDLPERNWEIVNGAADVCYVQDPDPNVPGAMSGSIALVRQRVKINAPKTCLFCYLPFFDTLLPEAYAVFVLPNECCGTQDVNGRCRLEDPPCS